MVGEVVGGEVVGGEVVGGGGGGGLAADGEPEGEPEGPPALAPHCVFHGAPQMQTPWTQSAVPSHVSPGQAEGSQSSAAISGQRMLPLTPSPAGAATVAS